MRRFEPAYQDDVDRIGAGIAGDIVDSGRVRPLRARVRRERRRWLARWGSVGAVGVLVLGVGVVQVGHAAWDGLVGDGTVLSAGGSASSEPYVSLGPWTEVGVERVTVGDGSVVCGSEWSAPAGVTLHRKGVVTDGASLVVQRETLVDADQLAQDAMAAGFTPRGVLLRATLQLELGDSLPGLHLRSESFAVLGGVVVGWMPSLSAEPATVEPWGALLLEAKVPLAVPGSCGTGADGTYASDGVSRVVVTQLQDEEGSPVVTWVHVAEDPVTGPLEVAGVSLTCGSEFPGSLPEAWWPVEAASEAGDQEASSGEEVAVPVVGRVIGLGVEDDEAVAKDGAVTADVSVAQVRIVERAESLAYYATAVVVDDGQIITSVALPVLPQTTDGWEGEHRLDGSVPLRLWFCHGRDWTEQLYSDGAGAGYEVHVAVVAIDESGETAGYWFDPEGMPVTLRPHLGGVGVDGWEPVQSEAAARVRTEPLSCGDSVLDLTPGTEADLTVRGLHVEARSFVVQEELHVVEDPAASVEGLTPFYVEVALERRRDGVTYEVSVVVIRGGVVVGVTDLNASTGPFGELPTTLDGEWSLGAAVAPGRCDRGEPVGVVDGAAQVHLTVRALDPSGVLGGWFDPTGGAIASLEFVVTS